MAPSSAGTAYDLVPYRGVPFPQTHPDRLATIAALLGMRPARVEGCRVLELGCGDGGNLLPMALTLPGATFLGVDLAATAIEKAASVAAQLGLRNVRFQHADLRDLAADLGPFDFVIAHGLFSWVPTDVQERLFALCGDLLAPHGVAYVSYNAYPGFYARQPLREMLLFHTARATAPDERLEGARALLRFLADALPTQEPTAAFLRAEVEAALESGRALLLHDDLAEVNEPQYFVEFAERAAAYGLQYLGEADHFDTQADLYPPAVVDALRQVEQERGLLHKEQYLDFLKLRRFRQTLLCHADVVLERPIQPEGVRACLVSSAARPVAARPDLEPGQVAEFRGPRGAALRTDHPLTKAALVRLADAWPTRLRFPALLAEARTLLEGAHHGPAQTGSAEDEAHARDEDEEATLAEILLRAYMAGLVDLHQHQPRLVLVPGERPTASPLARLQAAGGVPIATTILHQAVRLDDDLGRYALTLLDGTRDRRALLAALQAWVASQPVAVAQTADAPPADAPPAPRLPHLDAEALEGKLREMGRLGLLIA